MAGIRSGSGADIAPVWAAVWDAAPVWCLALQAGLCGPAPMLGVMLPSTDRGGRRFPLLCAAEGAVDGSGGESLAGTLEMIGRLAIEDGSTPEQIRERLGAVRIPASNPVEMPQATAARWWRGGAMQDVRLPGMPDAPTFLRLLTSG
ncbi:MAG: type VI secretion system-associated protein TagF [Rhodopila sp.]